MIKIWSNKVMQNKDLDYILDQAYETFKNQNYIKSKKEYQISLLDWLNNPETGLAIAYDLDRPIGFLLHRLTTNFDRFFYKNAISNKQEINFNYLSRSMQTIIVEESYQGKGIGKKLVKRVIEDSRNEGIKQLYATCCNAHGPQSYYLLRNFRFTEIKNIKGCYADKSDAVVMYKEIEPIKKFSLF